jgi:hypothetical protein
MNRAGPPEERADREVATTRSRKNKNAAQLIADFPELRNIARIVRVRYCLEPEAWEAVQWRAASETGGWYP